jgi:hypothetical protein
MLQSRTLLGTLGARFEAKVPTVAGLQRLVAIAQRALAAD